MKQIRFSDIGVVVNSMEDVDEIYLTYTALGIPFALDYIDSYKEAQNSLEGYSIQCTQGNIKTKLDGGNLSISLINYPIMYSMESLDFAIACQLLRTNQETELITHLDKYCKEYI